MSEHLIIPEQTAKKLEALHEYYPARKERAE